MKAFYGHYLAFASIVASPSHDCASISPIGSTNLTPLSHSGLCDAVIITPIVAEKKNVAGLKHTYLVHILGKKPDTTWSKKISWSVTSFDFRSDDS